MITPAETPESQKTSAAASSAQQRHTAAAPELPTAQGTQHQRGASAQQKRLGVEAHTRNPFQLSAA